jgi:hypothetical protein
LGKAERIFEKTLNSVEYTDDMIDFVAIIEEKIKVLEPLENSRIHSFLDDANNRLTYLERDNGAPEIEHDYHHDRYF